MLVVSMFVSAKKRNVIHHELDIEQLNDDGNILNVFFISDIHRRTISDKLLAQVGSDIDVVIIGGDLAERGVPLPRIAKNVQRLSRLGPVYYTWGNNDREVGEQEIRNIMMKNGAIVLDNENGVIPNHPLWKICGTDDPSSRNVNIAAALKGVHEDDNVIFVTHQPEVLEKVEFLFKPTLMLAGHTHGGQIRIGKLGLFEKGAYVINGHRAKLISNGYGTSSIPFRLGAPPQCHVITLRYNESEVRDKS